jgi:hypothetical protein
MFIPDAVPRWKRLCIIATAELNPTVLAQRIEEARHAIFDQIEDLGHSTSEQVELRNALETLNLLEKSSER